MTLAEGLSPWPVQVRPREPTSADAGVTRMEERMPDYSLSVSYQDGRWSAHHVCDPAEDLPTLADLAAEHMDHLRFDYPDATDATLEPYALAWAQGWLSVAERERKTWLDEQALACEEV